MNRSPMPIVLTVLIVAALGCSALAVFAEAGRLDEDALERNLREEIRLLHLINGLELTSAQMRFVLERACRVRDLRDQISAAEEVAQRRAVLEEFHAKLLKRESIDQPLEKRLNHVEAEIHDVLYSAKDEIERMAREVQDDLEDFQLYELGDYHACVVMPSGGSRIGQPSDAGAGRALERVRKMPKDMYQARRLNIARHLMTLIGHKVPVGFELPHSEEEEVQRVVAILDKVHSLPEVGFAVQTQEIVDQLAWPYGLKLQGRTNDVTAAIARHLLNPAIIPLLEAKLAAAQ